LPVQTTVGANASATNPDFSGVGTHFRGYALAGMLAVIRRVQRMICAQ
jgi:hypothetical protein